MKVSWQVLKARILAKLHCMLHLHQEKDICDMHYLEVAPYLIVVPFYVEKWYCISCWTCGKNFYTDEEWAKQQKESWTK